MFPMAFYSGWKNNKPSKGWSVYPERKEVKNQLKNIAGYGSVGYQGPRVAQNSYENNQERFQSTHVGYQSPVTAQNQRNFYQNQNFQGNRGGPRRPNWNSSQNKPYNRNNSRGRVRRSEEGLWLGTSDDQKQNHPQNTKETPTQTVINGQSDKNCRSGPLEKTNSR